MPEPKEKDIPMVKIGFPPEHLEAIKEMTESFKAAEAALRDVEVALKEKPKSFFKLIPHESFE